MILICYFDADSMNMTSHKRSRNVSFYNLGLGGSDTRKGTWTLRTLSSILRQFGEQNVCKVCSWTLSQGISSENKW